MPDFAQMAKAIALGALSAQNPNLAAQISQGWKQEAANAALMDYRNRALAQQREMAQMQLMPDLMKAQREKEAAARAVAEMAQYRTAVNDAMLGPNANLQAVQGIGQQAYSRPDATQASPRTQAELNAINQLVPQARMESSPNNISWAEANKLAWMYPGQTKDNFGNLLEYYKPQVTSPGQELTSGERGTFRQTQNLPEEKANITAQAGEKQINTRLSQEALNEVQNVRKLVEQRIIPPEQGRAEIAALLKRGGGVTINNNPELKNIPYKNVSDIETGVSNLQDLDNMLRTYDPSKVGPVTGRIKSFLAKLGLVDSETQKFYAHTYHVVNQIIKQITGAQMSEREALRIMREVPDINDPPEAWAAKFGVMRQRIIETIKAHTNQGLAAKYGYKVASWNDLVESYPWLNDIATPSASTGNKQPLPSNVKSGQTDILDYMLQEKVRRQQAGK